MEWRRLTKDSNWSWLGGCATLRYTTPAGRARVGLQQPPWARKIMCRLIRSHSSSRVVLGWITFSFVVAPKAHGWKSPNRGYRRLQRGGWGPSLFVTSAVVGEGLYGPPALEEEAGTLAVWGSG